MHAHLCPYSEARSALVGGPLGMLGAAALFGSLASAGAAALVGSSSAHADAAKPEIKVCPLTSLPALTVPRMSGYRRVGVRKAPSTQHRAMHASRSFNTMPCKLQGVNCIRVWAALGRGKRWTRQDTLPGPPQP